VTDGGAVPAGAPGPPAGRGVEGLAGAAWAFRWKVEREAEVRFETLATRLDALGEPARIVDLARRAAADERRHAAHCARLAASFGAPVPEAEPPPPRPVAPARLDEEDRVTYELVAACCVSESVSVAVLTRLLAAARDPALRAVLRELAEDEVGHARLGWAHLALAAKRGRTAFLGPLLPAMLRGTADDVFQPVEPAREDEALLAVGVLPHGVKRDLFVRALEDVVLPGLEGAGVDTGAARGWLAAVTAAR
jgi:rubrerythrin